MSERIKIASIYILIREKEVDKHMRTLDYTALTVAVVGAVVWGLVGLFNFNLVSFLFGNMTWLSRIIYVAVGICGLYTLTFFGRIREGSEE